jgi:hypothetical protein
MDRRRFIPLADTLETRLVLSTYAHTSVGLVNTEVALSTIQQRNQRIDRLPHFLATINQTAAIPYADLAAPIQQKLRLLLGTMHAASNNGLAQVNSTLRGIVKQQTISPAQVAQLNHDFTATLQSAGADPNITGGLQDDLTNMARVSSAATGQSASLVANQYALVLQLALAVGKPLPAPGVAKLSQADDTPPKNDNKTSNPQPTLVGRYEAGTYIQILSAQSLQVMGTAQVGNNGQYRVQFASPLAPGTYTLKMRALGPQNSQSLLSRPFKIGIVLPTPKGPRALMR